MPTVVDVAALGSGGFVIQGDAAGDRAGFSVSSVGDFNGDGFDDIIVGAPFNDSGGADSGAAYLIYGSASGLANLDLGNLSAAQGFRIQGDRNNSTAGLSVSSAGDINGDGFDDLIVGATSHGLLGYGTNLSSYVIFGRAAKPASIDLTGLSATDGFLINSGIGKGYTGEVAAAGDINGDGFDDIIIGSPYDNSGSGGAYVIFGKASAYGTVDATNPGSNGFVMTNSALVHVGESVAGVGDINGDGFDDIIVTSDWSGWYYGTGTDAYVIFGKQDGFANFDLGHLKPSDGFMIYGVYGDAAKKLFSVSSAGDVNGDGFDDILVGTGFDHDGAGSAYVIFGKAGGFDSINLSTLAPSAGFVIRNDVAHGLAGFSVSAAGDVNRDGFDDLIVGAPGEGTHTGDGYVIFGKGAGFGTLNLSELQSNAGLIIRGAAAGDSTGFSVSGGADVNGDGVADVIVGAPDADGGGASAGAAYVIYGDRAPLAQLAQNDFNGDGRSDLLWTSDAGLVRDWLGQGNGAFAGNVPNLNAKVDLNVWHVAGTGDFNGDGYFDLLWRSRDGTVTEWAGKANGSFAPTGVNTSASTDWQIAGIADFNGDGRSDILWRNAAGTVRDSLGQANGSFTDNVANLNIAVPNDWHIVATGDFNGDGSGDVLWASDGGLVRDWLGQANGGFVGNVANLNAHVDANVWHVVGVGDFDGDHIDDILWRSADGTVTEWLGHSHGGFTSNAANLNAKVATIWHVASIGDYNGDGMDDITWRSEDGTTTEWLGQTSGAFHQNSSMISVPLDWHVQSPFLHDPMT